MGWRVLAYEILWLASLALVVSVFGRQAGANEPVNKFLKWREVAASGPVPQFLPSIVAIHLQSTCHRLAMVV
jgi:hypothetical protein